MVNTLTLTFEEGVDILNNDYIDVLVDTGAGIITVRETFKYTRNNSGESEITTPYDPIEAAINYGMVFSLDARFTGAVNKKTPIYALPLDDGTVVISTSINYWTFAIPEGTAVDSGAITFIVNNEDLVPEEKIWFGNPSENTDPCDNYDLQVYAQGGSETYNAYVDNVRKLSNQLSPMIVTLDRGVQQVVRLTDSSSGSTIGLKNTYNTRTLIPNDITLGVQNFSVGVTVTVTVEYIGEWVSSEYSYSLDGITFQQSNVFTGQAAGDYTMYVMDALGCIQEKSYVLDGVTTLTETVFEVSNINSFRFSEVNDGKKNQLNTLSGNELTRMPYAYSQQFLQNEVITTQFKTNANYIDCFTVNCKGETQDLTFVQKTDNIGIKVKTSSTYFNSGNGKSAVYFGVVSVYDYLTDNFIEQVNYGSALPLWVNTIGGFLTIEGIGEVEIHDIIYSEYYNSFVAEINLTYTGNPVQRKASNIYNLQPYEIYEFNTVINQDFFNVCIQVGIDEDNLDFNFLSEQIQTVSDSEFLFDITYWDDVNKGKFNYQTNIQNKLHLNGYQENIGEQETEGYNGDDQFYVTDNIVYDVQSFTFNRLSSGMVNKLRLVFAHKYIVINGLSYKLSESPTVSGNLNSNMRKFVVNLKQSGEQFLTTAQELITDSADQQSINVALESAKGKGLLLWTKNY